MALDAEFGSDPFRHWIIDEFVAPESAHALIQDFLPYDSPLWFQYNNALEQKKTLRDWGKFPAATYRYLCYLCSPAFVQELELLTGYSGLVPDYGLHGAGWHIHASGDHLNLHLDYNQHPLLKMQRCLNLIVYLTPDWQPHWGGGLEFWSHDHDRDQPAQRRRLVQPSLGRAVLFDTQGWAWHGFPETLQCPPGVYRRSIAMYYLTDRPVTHGIRPRARYWPRPNQQHDKDILALIQARSQLD